MPHADCRSSGWATCQLTRIRSKYEWWKKKTGSMTAGGPDAMSPPKNWWTNSCGFHTQLGKLGESSPQSTIGVYSAVSAYRDRILSTSTSQSCVTFPSRHIDMPLNETASGAASSPVQRSMWSFCSHAHTPGQKRGGALERGRDERGGGGGVAWKRGEEAITTCSHALSSSANSSEWYLCWKQGGARFGLQAAPAVAESGPGQPQASAVLGQSAT